MSDLRNLPSIDHLLSSSRVKELISLFGRPLTLEALRCTVDEIRASHSKKITIPETQEILSRAHRILEGWTSPTLVPLINGTGIIVHTNLGRAPLSQAAIQAMQEVAVGYSNLEYDLDKGGRGSRLIHAEELLQRLTGAEAALVVNNNASAVLLTLTALAKRRRVLIARSQLVEIGGGFRIPDVMAQSGAILVEIGTTNRVHLRDYQEAIDEQPIKLVMRVHRSNFAIIGFHTEPDLKEVSQAAHDAGIPVVEDLGSGTLIDTVPFGLDHEPTIQETLAGGADLVTFSGDKLLGGPQAGVIVGKAELVNKLKKHPIARAIRADKLALAGLSATLSHYLLDEMLDKIPVWQMISASEGEIQERAVRWADSLGDKCDVIDGFSMVGGGSLPGQTLPTHLLSIQVSDPTGFVTELRKQQPPVIARVNNDRIVIDPRTVLPDQEETLLSVIKGII